MKIKRGKGMDDAGGAGCGDRGGAKTTRLRKMELMRMCLETMEVGERGYDCTQRGG